MLICDSCNRQANTLLNGLCQDCRSSRGKEAVANMLGGKIARILDIRYDGYQPEVTRNGRTVGGYMQFTDMGVTLSSFYAVSLKNARERLIEMRVKFGQVAPIATTETEEVAA